MASIEREDVERVMAFGLFTVLAIVSLWFYLMILMVVFVDWELPNYMPVAYVIVGIYSLAFAFWVYADDEIPWKWYAPMCVFFGLAWPVFVPFIVGAWVTEERIVRQKSKS